MKIKVLDLKTESETSADLVVPSNKDKAIEHVLYLLNNYQSTQEKSCNGSAKTRAEVSGGGAKPYRQKGTGRARRGTSSSPLMVGGGVVFAPKHRNISSSLTRKVKQVALKSMLNISNNLVVLKNTDPDEFIKTKSIKAMIDKVSGNKSLKKLVYITNNLNESILLSLNNLRGMRFYHINHINIVDYVNSDIVMISESALEELKSRVTNET